MERAADGFYHPSTEEAVAALIRRARAEHRTIRVHGARHSEPEIIGSDAFRAGRSQEGFDLRLDRLRAISVDRANKEVRVEAGCRFGADPREANLDATWDNSLNAALDAAGLALPNLGGISHQTIGGFLMTGSAGGSLRHAVSDAIRSIRFIDGQGQLQEVSSDDPCFFAVGVSFGLLGIVTAVRFACVDRYDVEGGEQILPGNQLPFDRDADGEAGLEGYLRQTEYARLLWWPQPGVDKWVLWSGQRAPIDAEPLRAYEAFPPMLGSPLIPQVAAGKALETIGRSPWWLGARLKTALVHAFVPTDPHPRPYRDRWWRAIPMDDGMDESLLPTRFTEIWLPLSATGEVLRRLKSHYLAHGAAAAGIFALEIYGAPSSPFWGSPGYGRDSLRLNFFWFDKTHGNPARTFFPQFWELFADLEPRFHWGKLMPEPDTPAAIAMRQSLSRLPELLAERERLDPDDVFLTDPWRARLGLGGPPSPAELAPFVQPLRKTLLFPVEAAELDLAVRADHRLRAELEIGSPADRLYQLISEGPASYLPGFRRRTIIDGELPPDRRRLRDHFVFTTLDLRVLVAEPGARWAARLDASATPVASALLAVVDLMPAGPGRTRVRAEIHLRSLPLIRWAEPLLLPLVRWWLRASLRRLRRVAELPPVAAPQ